MFKYVLKTFNPLLLWLSVLLCSVIKHLNHFKTNTEFNLQVKLELSREGIHFLIWLFSLYVLTCKPYDIQELISDEGFVDAEAKSIFAKNRVYNRKIFKLIITAYNVIKFHTDWSVIKISTWKNLKYTKKNELTLFMFPQIYY